LRQQTWHDGFAHNGLNLPARLRPSFDRAALSIAAAVDGMDVALESTRLAERVLSRETHFLSWRTSDLNLPRVRWFRGWLAAELTAAADTCETLPSPRRRTRPP